MAAAGMALAGTVAAAPPLFASTSSAPQQPVPVMSPLDNPRGNLQPPTLSTSSGPCRLAPGSTNTQSPSSWDCQSPCYPHWNMAYNDSPACLSLLMSAINSAQRSEDLQPLVLPSNFRSLSVPQQLFVLVNLERVSRRVPPIAGLSPYLSSPAMAAAEEAKDPGFSHSYGPVEVWWPPAGGMYGFGSTWAGNNVNAAAVVFGWMYDDGWGGSPKMTTNLACTGPGATGCWGHRDILLGASTGTTCADCVAGAGFAMPAQRPWTDSYTLLLVRPVSYPTPLGFTWARDVVPYLPPGWERAGA
jgi:hypothetical protein